MNYEKIIKEIKPTPEEMQKVKRISANLMNEINKLGYEAVLVGSTARNTYLKGSHDMDIFVFFPKNMKRERFEELGLKLGKTVLKKYHGETHYAEHPYVKGNVEGIDVDIVPCYKIAPGEEIISAVDRSPLHNDYIGKKIKGLEDQVLLLKKFMKANGCYGADQRMEGFSGVLCEVLIIEYKTFDKLIEAAAKTWKDKILINTKDGDEKKFKEQLIVIDPTDANRNMAAAVSRDKLSRFILKARKFIEKPSIDFFFPKPIKLDVNDMKKRRIVIIDFIYPRGVIAEIVWAQLKKVTKLLKLKLELEGYAVQNDFCWTDEKKLCAILFEFENKTVNKYKKRKGPEIFDAENAKKFMEKYKIVWVDRNTIYALQERKYQNVVDYLKRLLQKETLPSHLQKNASRARISQEMEIFRLIQVLTEYVKEQI